MAHYINPNDTIESSSCNVYAKCIRWGAVVKHPITQKRMLLCKLSRICDVTILEEYPEPTDATIKENLKHINRSVGDKISGESISCYIAHKRRITFNVVAHSGRHQAQFAAIPFHTISSIKHPLPGFVKHINELIQIEPKLWI